MEPTKFQTGKNPYRRAGPRDFRFIRVDKEAVDKPRILAEEPRFVYEIPKSKVEKPPKAIDPKPVYKKPKTTIAELKATQKPNSTVEEKKTSKPKPTVKERNSWRHKNRSPVEKSKPVYHSANTSVETQRSVRHEKEKPKGEETLETIVLDLSDNEEVEEERSTDTKRKETKEDDDRQVFGKDKTEEGKREEKEIQREEEKGRTWIKEEKKEESFSKEAWLISLPPEGNFSTTTPAEDLDDDREDDLSMAKGTTKIAFADPKHSFVCAERINYMPHVILIVLLVAGTVFMLASVGSSQWMEAHVSGLTVQYGLFERCAIDSPLDVTFCEAFDWPGWMYDTTNAEKMTAIKILAIISIFFTCMFSLGALLLLLTSACDYYRGWCRKAFVIVVDICLWLMISSAAVSSLVFVTGAPSVQAYPDSKVLWAPVLYCAGWVLCLLSRLCIAACCDVHHPGDNTMPFA